MHDFDIDSHLLDPAGFRQLTKYLYDRYKLPIYCTENGFSVLNEDSMPLLDALNDTDRVDYYRGVCEALLESIHDDGVDLKSYFPWSTFLRFCAEACPSYSPDFLCPQASWITLNGLTAT